MLEAEPLASIDCLPMGEVGNRCKIIARTDYE